MNLQPPPSQMSSSYRRIQAQSQAGSKEQGPRGWTLPPLPPDLHIPEAQLLGVRSPGRGRRTEKTGEHTALGPGESPGLQGASPPCQRLRDQLGFKVLHFALVGEDEEGAVVAAVCELHQRAAQLLIPEVRGFKVKGHHGHLHRLVLAHMELCLLSVFGVKGSLPLG